MNSNLFFNCWSFNCKLVIVLVLWFCRCFIFLFFWMVWLCCVVVSVCRLLCCCWLLLVWVYSGGFCMLNCVICVVKWCSVCRMVIIVVMNWRVCLRLCRRVLRNCNLRLVCLIVSRLSFRVSNWCWNRCIRILIRIVMIGFFLKLRKFFLLLISSWSWLVMCKVCWLFCRMLIRVCCVWIRCSLLLFVVLLCVILNVWRFCW